MRGSIDRRLQVREGPSPGRKSGLVGFFWQLNKIGAEIIDSSDKKGDGESTLGRASPTAI